MSLAATSRLSTVPTHWELAAETIAVKIRWFGLLVGYVFVNVAANTPQRRAILNAILSLGAVFTILDTWFSVRGRIFLGNYPLFISLIEALFIALLCYFDEGLQSSFRYYYLLSLICCAIRHSPQLTYATCGLHCLSYGVLYFTLPEEGRNRTLLALTVVVLCWVTWASNALALLLKRVGNYLGQLNATLERNKTELEARIAERTRELQEAQAQMLHQEKMAAFGLLAAGIAHEVGNPLTSISSIVQLLQRRDCDAYTQDRLGLVSGQLQRIRVTLRELVEFSRPASTERIRVSLADILDEALNIAKYYKRTRGRIASPTMPPDLPPLLAVRDQLVQVFLNLVLNAIDVTDRDGRIELSVTAKPGGVEVSVRDSGSGVAPENMPKLFQPYFTTKTHGTGLGLFVTRKLVEEHGGTVEFESTLGEGTVFRVYLPVSQTEAASW